MTDAFLNHSPFRSRLQYFIAVLALAGLFYFSMVGVVLYPYIAIEASGTKNLVLVASGLAFFAVALYGVSRLPSALGSQAVRWVEQFTPRQWFVGVLSIAAAHLILQGFVFGVDITAQEAGLVTARRLVLEGVYDTPGEYYFSSTQAFYPPGRYLYMGLFSSFLGDERWVVLLANSLLAVLTLVFGYKLGRLVAGEAAARITVLLISIWPGYMSGLFAIRKEILAVPLFIMVLYYFLRWLRDPERALYLPAVSGLLLGMLVLTQPSMMLVPLVFFGFDWIRERIALRRLMGHGLLVLCMVLTVSPWTYRNYQLFDRFIPVTVNFGYSLYVGNNPDADGSWGRYSFLEGFEELGYDELSGGKVAKEAALEWIRSNPGEFLKLIPRRHMYLMVQDSTNVLWLARAAGMEGTATHSLARTITNVFWALLLVCLAAAVIHRWRRGMRYDDLLILPILIFLYVASIHSIVESGDRHHLVFGPLFMLLIGSWIASAGLDGQVQPRGQT